VDSRFKTLLVLVFVLAPSLAWLTDYDYKRPFYVNETASLNYSEGQLNVTLDTETLIAAGKMESDCDDLRITNSADSLLNISIFSCNTSATIIQIKLDTLEADATNEEFLAYYGNAGASSFSNWSSTFPLWEDCNTIDGTKWLTQGSVTADGGLCVLNANGEGMVEIWNSTDRNWAGEMRVAAYDTGASQYVRWGFQSPTDAMFGNPTNWGFGAGILQGTTSDDRLARVYQDDDSKTDTEVEGSPPSAHHNITWLFIYNSTGLTYYNNSQFWYLQAASIISTTAGMALGIYGTNADATIDYVRRWRYTTSDPVYYWGSEAAAGAAFDNLTYSPDYPLINETVTLNVSWTNATNYFTKTWWDFGDGNTTYNYYVTPTNYVTMAHKYTSNNSYAVNVTGYDQLSAANTSINISIDIYSTLAAVYITVSDYLPFLAESASQNMSYTNAGGTGTFNSSWEIILPNTSTFTYVNQSPLTFTPSAPGLHLISLDLCDMVDNTCVSDSDSYKPWNVTASAATVSVFNSSPTMLTARFVNDQVTFTSADSLNWSLGTTNRVGTSATFSLAPSSSYWNNTDYYHFNFTFNLTWGNYSATRWATTVAARYYINDTTAWPSNRNNYCFVYAELYDEETRAEIASASNDYSAVFTTTTGYGHEQESGVDVTKEDLNATLSMNATPILSNLWLDGLIIYTSPGYAERTYSFDNASIAFVSACTTGNGQKLVLYTANSTDTETVTITVAQGGIALEDATVQIQSYNADAETYVTVASQVTDVNGQIQLELELCPTYYKIIILDSEGEVLDTRKTCIKSTSYEINIDSSLPTFFTVHESISSSCSYSNITQYFSCTISDSTGLTATSTLEVYSVLSTSPICTSSESSTSTTLLCDMSTHGEGDFMYKLYVTMSGEDYGIETGSFTIGSAELIGTDGGVILLLLLGVVAIGGAIFGSPLLAIIMSTAVIILGRQLDIISLGSGVVGWVLTLALIAAMKVLSK